MLDLVDLRASNGRIDRRQFNRAFTTRTDPDVPDIDVVVSEDLATLRSYELDALSAIIPPDHRDRWAEILSDDHVATRKHLVKQGTGANTLRAIASDPNYLET